MGLNGTPDNVNFPLPDPATFPATRYGEVSGKLTLTSTHGPFTAIFAGRNPQDNVPNASFPSTGSTLVMNLSYTGEYSYTVRYATPLSHQHPEPYAGTAPSTGVIGPFQVSVRPCIGCLEVQKPG